MENSIAFYEAMRRAGFAGTAFGYEVWNAMIPDVVVDITAVAEQKRRAIRAHRSQTAYVDFEQGNWCEGLTAYMADHLIQEQRGKGAEYRRGALQKYRNYVKDSRDFPLREFRSRHSAATEAVGYGKTLMGFHMLRRRLGDDAATPHRMRYRKLA